MNEFGLIIHLADGPRDGLSYRNPGDPQWMVKKCKDTVTPAIMVLLG